VAAAGVSSFLISMKYSIGAPIHQAIAQRKPPKSIYQRNDPVQPTSHFGLGKNAFLNLVQEKKSPDFDNVFGDGI